MIYVYVEHLHLLTILGCIISVSLNGYASDHSFGNMEMVIIFSFYKLENIRVIEVGIEQNLLTFEGFKFDAV